jgi:hypothetical protein
VRPQVWSGGLLPASFSLIFPQHSRQGTAGPLPFWRFHEYAVSYPRRPDAEIDVVRVAAAGNRAHPPTSVMRTGLRRWKEQVHGTRVTKSRISGRDAVYGLRRIETVIAVRPAP